MTVQRIFSLRISDPQNTLLSRIQAAEMDFVQNVRSLYLIDKDKSTDISQSLNITPLLLLIEQSQLRWYGHVTRMSHKRTAKQLLDTLPSEKGLEDSQELAGGIMLKTWPDRILEFYRQNPASCRRLRCLEIPTQAAAPTTPKGQASNQ